MTDTEIGDKYGTHRTNILNYRKKRDTVEKNLETTKPEATRPTRLKFPEIDKAMIELVDETLDKGGNITGRLIQLQARKFARENDIQNFTGSNGWLASFCERHDLIFKVLQSEGASANFEGLQEWYDETLPSILQDYALKDVINCDELGLNYSQLPNKSLIKKSQAKPKGCKLRKDRITVLLTCSATGERKMPLVIGTAKNLRPFVQAGLRDGRTKHLGFAYKNNKTAWMDTDIFTEYLEELNTDMILQKRYIALILDNFKAHNVASLSNVHLYFLPPNVTSHAQPLDAGIIKNFRDHFRTLMASDLFSRLRTFECVDDYYKGVTLLEACLWTVEADKAITTETRVNCFAQCRIG
ncbi:hypothetical protein RvY_08378 [Ramazzottius varieornatus]|uniref:HTH CENPB-type domain-containing protein n=1 Tax=Ramazzottius varieornatus TaxID=947166 RepID=A0A1D1V8A7_RAMVA|nr:hypothetical protein RvY_08378 [Ramazzottius varieornatus]